MRRADRSQFRRSVPLSASAPRSKMRRCLIELLSSKPLLLVRVCKALYESREPRIRSKRIVAGPGLDSLQSVLPLLKCLFEACKCIVVITEKNVDPRNIQRGDIFSLCDLSIQQIEDFPRFLLPSRLRVYIAEDRQHC